MALKKHVITVAAVKGGTGKTTVCGALAQAAKMDGRRVLCVDMDPQASLSYWMGTSREKLGAYALLNGCDPEAAIQRSRQGIDIIAGSPDLIGIGTSSGSARRLEAALDDLNYNFIVIDTGPAPGELMNNAFFASTEAIFPLRTEIMSLNGLATISGIFDQIRAMKPELRALGVVINEFDRRPNVNRQLRELIIEYAADAGIPYLGEIRRGIAVEEAMALQRSLFEHAPKSKPAEDLRSLYEKIVRKRGGAGK